MCIRDRHHRAHAHRLGPAQRTGRGGKVLQGNARGVKHLSLIHISQAEALAAACGPNTRAVILNTPNNPTGVCLTAEQLSLIHI